MDWEPSPPASPPTTPRAAPRRSTARSTSPFAPGYGYERWSPTRLGGGVAKARGGHRGGVRQHPLAGRRAGGLDSRPTSTLRARARTAPNKR